jgi:lipopolysaccharide biosynthesis glycosyltransferase
MQYSQVTPAFDQRNIPIFFTCDCNFSQYLAVAIQSLREHASNENNYDIVVLEDGFNEKIKQQIFHRSKFS